MSEELEYQISQYLDGTLSDAETFALKERLASDEEALRVFEEYVRLQQHVATALPLPAVDWNRLAERLSDAAADAREPAIAGRIGWGRKFAIAASILIVLGLSLVVGHEFRSDHAIQPMADAIAQVTGPQAETASGPAVVEIAIGPSPALKASFRYAEGVVTRPSRVELAGAIYPPADGDSHIH
jgi:anti-sigma factor RsiW